MYNEKFISKEQLEELEKKADELNALIKKLKNKNRLADYCMLRPLNTPRNIKNDIPVFGFKDLYDTDVWNCFCKLATDLVQALARCIEYRLEHSETR